MNTYESRAKAKTVAVVISIIVVVGLVAVIEQLQNRSRAAQAAVAATGTSSPVTSSPAPTGSSSSPATATSSYKDGSYTADAQYYVPHGVEDIKVTLTVSGGVVTNSSIVNSESDQDSQRYQEDFASQYKTYVVGKNLADIKLSYVAGASDTTAGFDDAVSQIRNQAQA